MADLLRTRPLDFPTEALQRERYRRPINWALWIGLPLVALTLFLTLYGPALAPRDPMERTVIHRVEGRFLRPPAPPFTAPGFPLGSDEIGRDVLSRLLVGIRPTVVLVALTALLRLALGLLIGIGAGWSHRWGGKLLDTLIAGALALPLFIVALMVVIPLRERWGVWAFVLALCLTGWGDTARLVREQVRALRGSTFIEAGRALGSSDSRLIRSHVVRHLLPLLTILLAFEISATLLTVAGLGFMGQFVGGEYLLETDEPVKPSFAGQPELGQMLVLDLSTIFFGPWRVMASGGIVFLMVLGFNLLGDDLRWRFERGAQRPSRVDLAIKRFNDGFEERFRISFGRTLATTLLALWLLSLAAPRVSDWWTLRTYDPFVGRGGTVQIGEQQITLAEGSFPPVALAGQPADALWSSTLGDPHGARSMDAAGPESLGFMEDGFLWTHALPAEPSGAPVVDAAGNLYLALANQQLLSLDADGAERWTLDLDEAPVGSPAIGPDGSIAVADAAGGVSVVTADGERLDYLDLGAGEAATVGPMIASDGTLYLTFEGRLVAARDGEIVWEATLEPRARGAAARPPVVSAEGELLFMGATILRRADGVPLDDPLLDLVAPSHIATGGDGYNYMTGEGWTLRWAWDGERIQPIELRQWDVAALEGLPVADSGATRDGTAWVMSALDQFLGVRLFWIERGTRAVKQYPLPDARRAAALIGMDEAGRAYLCIQGFSSTSHCQVVSLEESEHLTSGPLSERFLATTTSATLVPGRMYLIGSVPMAEGAMLAAVGP